ncbi:MAG: fumarate hydratase [Planctomycetaceae bacterium]|nr:fumarate hydratase [Planctomycetaceae bacterium]
MIREIDVARITETVADLCIRANVLLNDDIASALRRGVADEEKSLARDVLNILLDNADVARQDSLPICQDTGMAVVFIELGQDAHLTGGTLEEAINAGVAAGYERGCLRKSVVHDPINRINTGDNTPAVVHVRIVPGNQLKITVAPKGFGSENMSRLVMLKPSDGLAGVKRVVLETVQSAGPNPCPPMIVGVGVGGTMEKAALIAKEALLRPVRHANPDPFWAGVETELLAEVNRLDVGPAGFGGRTTALAVHINVYPTHIAGLPVAVNIGCHVTRHAEAVVSEDTTQRQQSEVFKQQSGA